MPEKDIIANIGQFHAWLAGLTALWGGMVSYLRRVQRGEKFHAISAVMHLSMSAFAGLMCWLGCVQFDIPPALTAICTGLSGHMGAEFIKIIEDKFRSRIEEVKP